MSLNDRQFRPNDADVAAKVIDGEAIIMNLTSGAYYSMAGTGAVVWTLVEQGHTLSTIALAVSEAYQVPPATVRADLDGLVDQLVRENLVQEVSPSTGSGGPTSVSAGPDGQYTPPQLHKYTDMQDLLALDPPMPSLGKIGAEPATEA